MTEMAEGVKNKLTNWIKDHAGLWTFGILVVAILGLLGGIGARALESQDRKIMAALTAEAKRLDTRIDNNKELLQRIDKNIDALGKRMDQKIDNLSARMDQKIDSLSARVDQKIDDLSVRMDQKIDNLSARMDKVLDRLPAR